MSIPGSAEPLLLAQQDTGYTISRSLRFSSNDSAYLSRTPSSSGNRRTWTWAGWVKRGSLSGTQWLFECSTSATYYTIFALNSDAVYFYDQSNGAVTSTALYRDPGAWMHLVLAVDTTQATASNRVKMYVNGAQITALSGTAYPTQNADTGVNSATLHSIGARFDGSYSLGFNGYLADIHFIDGQALDPTSFTEVSATTGQLIPKQYTGSFGTNGFWLKFSDNSAATATTLGKDYSGNSNNWTPNNISVDQVSLNVNPYSPTITSNLYGGTQAAVLNNTNLNDYAQIATPNYGTYYWELVLGTPIPIGTSIKVNMEAAGGTLGNFVIRLNDNSATDTNMPVTGGRQTVTLNKSTETSLTKLRLFSPSGSGYGTYLYYILIDDIVLTQGFITSSNNDSLVDTPTSYGTGNSGGDVRGNYCTWNRLATDSQLILTNGNLDTTTTGAGDSYHTYGTIALKTGKWYCEFTVGAIADSGSAGYPMYGLVTSSTTVLRGGAYLPGGSSSGGVGIDNDGDKRINGTQSAYGPSYTAGDVISMAYDADNGAVYFAKNGTWMNGATASEIAAGITTNAAYTYSGGTIEHVIAVAEFNNSSSVLNAGQRQWAYAAPAGFKALCDTNLPAPVVAKPSTVMDVLTWTGNGGGSRSFTGLNFSPDLAWVKTRSVGYTHVLWDSVRGAGVSKELQSSSTNAEGGASTNVSGYLSSFNSDGFSSTAGSTDNDYFNRSATTYVAWTWDAGSSTVTNTQGSITSQVRANPSAGFSIVTYTGTGSLGTIGHGLGVKPAMGIFFRRSGGQHWGVYHSSLGASKIIQLDLTAAASADTGRFNGVEPTSSVFTINNDSEVNTSGALHIAYCFAPVAGYSAFGSYTGNGSADGPFVYTGFRPRWVMIKNSTSDGGGNSSWLLVDTARGDYNVVNPFLLANTSAAEGSVGYLDILSNGFKLRATGDRVNASATYIYAAFAESPFQYARAR